MLKSHPEQLDSAINDGGNEGGEGIKKYKDFDITGLQRNLAWSWAYDQSSQGLVN